MDLGSAEFRLRFKRPFGIAHGVRDGTDALFLKLDDGEYEGWGEVSFPPYLPCTRAGVAMEVNALAGWVQHAMGSVLHLEEIVQGLDHAALSPPARSLVGMALIDLAARRKGLAVWSMLGAPAPDLTNAMVTLGHCELHELPDRLRELPAFPILKVKLGTGHDEELVRRLIEVDGRPIFLDGNQGVESFELMLHISRIVGLRLVGIEQPFGRQEWDAHRALKQAVQAPVFADESVQGLEDLERASANYDGVNIKLMKCGGLDRAERMAMEAKRKGLKVMLGSMSESSLACTAMAHVSGHADLIDLDGPWLIQNDPFQGLVWQGKSLSMPVGTGIGARLVGELQTNPIGA